MAWGQTSSGIAQDLGMAQTLPLTDHMALGNSLFLLGALSSSWSNGISILPCPPQLIPALRARVSAGNVVHNLSLNLSPLRGSAITVSSLLYLDFYLGPQDTAVCPKETETSVFCTVLCVFHLYCLFSPLPLR